MENMDTVLALNPSYKDILFLDGETKLLDCISSLKKPNTLKRFLQDIADIDAVLPSYSPLWPGCTPLHLAVILSLDIMDKYKVAHLFKQFLDYGASVHVQNFHGATPIHLAFRLELHQVVALLLRHLESKPHEVVDNLLDDESLSYLHIACTANDHHGSFARKLLSNKRNIEYSVNIAFKGKTLATVKEGWTPLHVAVNQRRVALVQLLLQRGADLLCTDTQGYTLIHRLFGTTGTKTLVEVLLASEQLMECVVKNVGLTHLHVAVWFNDDKSVERLLDLGANIEATLDVVERKSLKKFSGCKPLLMAIIKGHLRTVKLLLQRGADVLAERVDSTSPLSKALTSKNMGLANEFVRMIWSDDELRTRLQEKLGFTMLHIACHSCDIDRVEDLLERDADVNARLHDHSNFWMGYTPLHVTIATYGFWFSGKELIIAKKLVKNECDVDQRDSTGKTALHLAVESKNREAAIALLSAGADVNIVDWSGKTATSYALQLRPLCKHRHELENVKLIIFALTLHLCKMKLFEIEVNELNEIFRKTVLRKVKMTSDVWNENTFYDQVQATEGIKVGQSSLNLRSFLRETFAVSMYPSLTPADRAEVDDFFRAIDDRSFPNVIPLLRLQHRKAVARLPLIDPARDSLKIFISSSFPDLCVDMILKYLSNSQIKQLIKASAGDTDTKMNVA